MDQSAAPLGLTDLITLGADADSVLDALERSGTLSDEERAAGLRLAERVALARRHGAGAPLPDAGSTDRAVVAYELFYSSALTLGAKHDGEAAVRRCETALRAFERGDLDAESAEGLALFLELVVERVGVLVALARTHMDA